MIDCDVVIFGEGISGLLMVSELSKSYSVVVVEKVYHSQCLEDATVALMLRFGSDDTDRTISCVNCLEPGRHCSRVADMKSLYDVFERPTTIAEIGGWR